MRAPGAVAEVEALLGEVEHLIVRAREVETVHNAQVEAGVVATLANNIPFHINYPNSSSFLLKKSDS